MAALAVVAAAQVGCGSDSDASSAPVNRTKSVPVSLRPVRAPLAPRPYRLPSDAVDVSSSEQLAAALEDGHGEAIVLRPGIYDNARPFADREGDRLYASRLGGAILRAGIVLGTNAGPPGALIQGLTFDVSDPAKTLGGAIVHVWGSGTDSSVLDTRLGGNGVADTGLLVRQPQGFVGRRIVATGFRSYGVAVDPNLPGYRTSAPFSLTDVTVSHVRRPVRGSSKGRAEACLWIGSPGTVKRARVRWCGITGIWTGTATRGSRLADLVIDRAPVGIYVEHYTTATTFQRLRVGPNVRRGVNAEWSDLASGQKPASSDNVIEGGYFHTTHVGVYLDQGTTRTVVRHSRFVGQSWAAIGDYLGNGNRYYANDFIALPADAVPVTHDHDPAGGTGP